MTRKQMMRKLLTILDPAINDKQEADGDSPTRLKEVELLDDVPLQTDPHVDDQLEGPDKERENGRHRDDSVKATKEVGPKANKDKIPSNYLTI